MSASYISHLHMSIKHHINGHIAFKTCMCVCVCVCVSIKSVPLHLSGSVNGPITIALQGSSGLTS